jgi:hypothetical protein
MCKEMVILVKKVVDPKRIIGKTEGRGGGEAQGVADPNKQKTLFTSTPSRLLFSLHSIRSFEQGCVISAITFATSSSFRSGGDFINQFGRKLQTIPT